jgi:hypothetical protein
MTNSSLVQRGVTSVISHNGAKSNSISAYVGVKYEAPNDKMNSVAGNINRQRLREFYVMRREQRELAFTGKADICKCRPMLL